MKYAYTRNTRFPALVVPVVMTAPDGAGLADADGKIDTGADVTMIPESICRSLGLRHFRFVTGVGARGERWKSISTYFVRIRPAHLPWFDVEVVSSPNDYVLLGRDILNQCTLHADGPAGFFELTPTP